MVNAALARPHPERALAIAYAPVATRAAFAALLALDERLAGIVAAARDPLVGQLRLTWWHDALAALDHAAPPPEPLLRTLAAEVLPRGVDGAALAGMIDGWELLLEPETLDRATHAAARGGRLFALAAVVLGAGDATAEAGAGWALAELARAGDAAARDAARALPMARRWSRAGRPLGALALSAAMDLAGRPPGSPARVARLLALRLTGR